MEAFVKEATGRLYVGLKKPCYPRSRDVWGCFSIPSAAYSCFAMENLTLSFPAIFFWAENCGHQNTCSLARRGQMALQSGLGRKLPTHGWLSTRSAWKVQFFFISGPRSEYLSPKPGMLLLLQKQSQGRPLVSLWEVTHSRCSQSKLQPTQRPG